MKDIKIAYIFLTWCCALHHDSVFSQKRDSTTILLVGTMHKLPGMLKGNYKYIKKKVNQFKPMIVCSEYITIDDTLSFIKFYNGDFIRRHDSTLRAQRIIKANVKKAIDSLRILLMENNSAKARYMLFKQYYYIRDFGNMAFQIYLLQKRNNKSDLSQAENKDVMDRYSRIRNNEYDLVAFPYCEENKIEYLYPIDDHTFESEYNEATKRWKSESGGELNLKQQAFISKYKRKLIWSFFAGRGGKKINSIEGQEFSRRLESSLFDSIMSVNYNDAAKYWLGRNANMAQNILSVAANNENKRIIVVVGASHVPFLKDYLKMKTRYRILTLPDL